MNLKKNITSTFLLLTLLLSVTLSNALGQIAGKDLDLGNSTVEGVPTATAPSLGLASTFSVLGASTVTNTGPSILTGHLGLSPGLAITGITPSNVLGSIFAGGAVPLLAQTHVGTAFLNLNLQGCTRIMTGEDLGQTVTPGVNCFAASAPLTGTLTLDAQGDPNAVFIFKIGSTLITATDSNVVLINGATACNTFFAVGSSATLGTGTQFEGNILALASVTLTTGVRVNGLVAAQTAAVTMDTVDVSTCALLAPSSATVNVSGRVVSSTGRGIPGTTIRLMDNTSSVRFAVTSTFGYYTFADVEVGQSLLISVSNKRYTFAEPERIVALLDEVSNIDFVAN